MIITIETDDLGRYVCTLDDGEARATVTASNVPDAAEQLSQAMDDVRETSYGECLPLLFVDGGLGSEAACHRIPVPHPDPGAPGGVRTVATNPFRGRSRTSKPSGPSKKG